MQNIRHLSAYIETFHIYNDDGLSGKFSPVDEWREYRPRSLILFKENSILKKSMYVWEKSVGLMAE